MIKDKFMKNRIKILFLIFLIVIFAVLGAACNVQNSESPINTPTNEPTDTVALPTEVPTPTLTPTPIETPTPVETPIETITPTETPTITPIETPTPVETPTPTLAPTPTPTQGPSGPTVKPTPMPPVNPSTGDTELTAQFTKPDFDNSGITNILLIGIDTRADIFSSSRSDVMMILSINEKENTVRLTSIMRDLRVKIAGRNVSTKINAAYAYGGPSCLIETIRGHFGIPIHHYVVVNFTGGKKIIDMLGGVDMEITDREAQFLKDPSMPKGGFYHMNANQTLKYMRLRYSDNDWFRTKRQGKVLMYLFNKYMNSSLNTILSVAEEATNYVRTDMTFTTMTSMLTKVYNCRNNGIDHTTYPIDNGNGSGRETISGSTDVKEKSYPVQINRIYQRIYGFTPEWK